MIYSMDIQQIQYFLDVAKTEHMTKSSERLHIAQPALSRSISRLEREFGVQLFARKGRGIKLTTEGKLLQQKLSRALEEIDEAKAELAKTAFQQKQTIHIHIGAASLLAIEAISDWMKLHPHVHIELVQAGQIEHTPDILLDSTSSHPYKECHVFSERIMVAVPCEPKQESNAISLSSLSDQPFISLSGSVGFRKTCDALCAASGFAPNISLESDNPDVVRKAIALGLGVGFWPERSWGSPGEKVRLIPLSEESFIRKVNVLLCEESTFSRDFYHHLISLMDRVFSLKNPVT